MKLKLLLLLCLLFLGSISRVQNTDSLAALLQKTIDTKLDSAVEQQMDSLWDLIEKSGVPTAQYIDNRAKGLDPGAELAAAWAVASAGTEVTEVLNTSSNLDAGEKHEAGLQSYVTIRLNKPA